MLLIALLSTLAHAEPDPARMLQDERPVSHGLLDATAHLGLRIWQTAISPGDGPRCPLRPSCSLYARQAVSRDGLGGVVPTFDRLLRDANAAAYEPAPMASTRWIRSLIILLLVLFSAAPGVAASEPTGPISASEAPDATPPEPAPPQPPAVADPIPLLIHLYRAEDFQGVRTESLRRQLDAPPSPVLQAELRYMEALARLALGEADAAMVDLDALRQQADAPPVAELAQLALAEAWLTQFPVQGVRMYQDYLAAHADSPWASPAAQRAAWGLAESGRFSMALTQLEGAGQPISPALRQTLTAPPRWKRPVLAAALSGALPGAGQLYARQPREALSAFAVNAVFFSGMALAARQRAWPAFGIAAFFGVGFYAGNIYGAADAALRYNRGARDDVMRTFEEELPPVEMPPAAAAMSGGTGYDAASSPEPP